ncbi:MAG TPA: RluA family pseudouridine synthase [Gammaproteobacteria bacterium]|nr:RluA family pseudouridine synthase [Gammaproteobacteria bacterium]
MNQPSTGYEGRARIVEAGEEDDDQRIDNFLVRHLKGVPRTHIYRLLRTGQVRVNGGRIKAQYRVRAGDKVRIPPVRQAEPAESAPAPPPQRARRELEGRILFEDDRVVVLNKPAGMAVHGGSGLSFGVIEAMRTARPDAPFLELAHRLDRETSGVLVLCKKRSALRRLHELLREGQVEKRYLALVAGSWSERREEIRLTLRKQQLHGGERMVDVSEQGKEAVSLFRPIQYFRGATLMEVDIKTGRTHQIRVQAAHLGHPLLGDDKYGDRDANRAFRKLGLKRLFLHAASIGFEWQDNHNRVDVNAPLDHDLRAVLERLER